MIFGRHLQRAGADSVEALFRETLDTAGLSEDYRKLLHVFAAETEKRQYVWNISPVVLTLLHSPLKLFGAASLLTPDCPADAAAADVQGSLNAMAQRALGLSLSEGAGLTLAGCGSYQELADRLQKYLTESSDRFITLHEEISRYAPDAAEKILQSVDTFLLADTVRRAAIRDALVLCDSGAGHQFMEMSLSLLEEISRETAGLHRSSDYANWPMPESIIMVPTPYGPVIVGSPADDVYAEDAFIIIEPGGDDEYRNNAGATVTKDNGSGLAIHTPAALVIDFNGNDIYDNRSAPSQGTGLFGMGLLIDLHGNDSYTGTKLHAGAALFGAGALIDLSGSDSYISGEGGQAAALWGAAMLYDAAGDDTYTAAKYAQAFAGPGGIALLRDVAGNDTYTADNIYPSGYGTPGVFTAMSQGTGWGIRPYAAGGIAILQDCAGDDVYDAGNFAQGTGYFFGAGILEDGSGNDRYDGSRYAQGSAAHLAAGVLIDKGGNDSYSGIIAAQQGGAWDLSVAGLFDLDGNDSYRGHDLSIGGGEQNAVGIFYEAAGNDEYEAGRKSLGFGGKLTYGGGRDAVNFGFFFDLGTGVDVYPSNLRQNSYNTISDSIGVFIDR